MKELLNKKVKIHRISNGRDLYYTAFVLSVTDTHITIRDRNEKIISFKIEEISEAEEND